MMMAGGETGAGGVETRPSGIDLLGNVGWGTHFCVFYETPQDLLEILVPWFREGLAGNEFCMWVTSEPLGAGQAEAALRAVVPDLDERLRAGQIDILDYADWYKLGGSFEETRVLGGWVKKLEDARARGFDGLRLTGNTFWLEEADWKDFAHYEASVNAVIGEYRMLAICTYSLARCGAPEIMDVIANHQFAMVKRRGRWEIVEGAEHRRMAQAVRESEQRFRALSESTPIHISVTGAGDGALLYVNRALADAYGYAAEELLGKKSVEMFVDAADRTRLADELKNHGSVREFEARVRRRDGSEMWVSTSINRIRFGGVAAMMGVSLDVTGRRLADEELRRRSEELSAANAELLRINGFMEGRELRMIELKKEVNELLVRADKPPHYQRDFEQER